MQILDTPMPRFQAHTVVKPHDGPNRKARRASAKAKRIANKAVQKAGSLGR